MRKMSIRSFVHPDKTQAIIALGADGQELASITLEAATLEKHIRKLAKVRALLKERVPAQLQPSSSLDLTHRAPLFLRQQRVEEGRVLAFRHPGFGWLAFTISDDHVESIVAWLTSNLPAQCDLTKSRWSSSPTRH